MISRTGVHTPEDLSQDAPEACDRRSGRKNHAKDNHQDSTKENGSGDELEANNKQFLQRA